jgi:thiamine biosynthesis lipoprotein
VSKPWQRIRQQPALGTFVEVGAVAAPGADPDRAIDAAFGSITEIQRLMSFHDPGSDLSRLNTANGAAVALNRPTVRVLRLARAMMCASGGLFDCTVGAQLVARGRLPDPGVAAEASGKAEDIVIIGDTVRLAAPVLVTLDGIAKGYAVDRAIATLRAAGCSGGYVNAGGDIAVFGPWPLPVHRREPDGTFTALGALRDGAIATSSLGQNADRFPGLIVGGDTAPSSGIFSVLSRRAWRADALTKVAALTPAAERAHAVARLGGHYVETP